MRDVAVVSPPPEGSDGVVVADVTGAGTDLKEGQLLISPAKWAQAIPMWKAFDDIASQLRRGPVELDDIRQDLVAAYRSLEGAKCRDVELVRATAALLSAIRLYRRLLSEWHENVKNAQHVRVVRAVARRAFDEARACESGQRTLVALTDEDIHHVPDDAPELSRRPEVKAWGRISYDDLEDLYEEALEEWGPGRSHHMRTAAAFLKRRTERQRAEQEERRAEEAERQAFERARAKRAKAAKAEAAATTAKTDTKSLEQLLSALVKSVDAAKSMPERTRAMALQTIVARAHTLAKRRDRQPGGSSEARVREQLERYDRAARLPMKHWQQNDPKF